MNLPNIIGSGYIAAIFLLSVMNLAADESHKKPAQPLPRSQGELEGHHGKGEKGHDHRRDDSVGENESPEMVLKKINHLREAAENLELAGRADEGRSLRADAEGMERRLRQQMEARDSGPRPPMELIDKIHQLENQLRELRKILHQQQEQINQLKKRGHHD